MGFSNEQQRLLTSPESIAAGDEENTSPSRVTPAAGAAPKDRFYIAYIVYFTLGMGFLLPWNAFITAVDYFSYLYPGTPVDRVFSVAYMVSCLVPLLFIVGWAHLSSAAVRINVGLVIFAAALVVVPVLDAVYVRNTRGLYEAYDVTVAAVVLSGVADALVQGGVIGSAGELSEIYMQAVVSGTAASGHSDPEKLKDKASDAQRLSPAELNKRQLEIKELMEKLKMPSDAELMKIAINDLNNSSLSLEDQQRALNELLILVEPIDNANDLDKLGGLVAVVRELDNPEPEIRTTSAWILGKACQNNALVQNQILALGVLTRLMKMVKSSSREEAIKALFAISALIRNSKDGQELFFSENGSLMLQDIMSNVSIDIRLQKKAVLLVADLADYQQESAGGAKHAAVSDRLLLKAVVDLASSKDLDLQEKALLAIKSLLQLPSTEALDFKDFCDLEKVLERIKEQLGKIKDHDYYAEEMKNLIREIHIIFHRKLEKVSWVPT